ncbi:glycosyltransferase [Solibacillus sp. FSL K6-4121]|uniref:glycosyltransferase n=1 Tax=Solibacillus sp. FSL K6-4121 TaxID=2921505 RepID=UPI0030F9B8CA
MKILYISSLNAPERASILEHSLKEKILNHQAQKFNFLMINGLVNNGCSVEHLTTCSHLSRLAKRKYLKSDVNYYFGMKFYSLPVLFIPVLQFIFAFFYTFFFIINWTIKNKEKKVIICDVNEVFHSFGALVAAKIMKVNTVAIVTDLPENAVGNKKTSNYIKRLVIILYKKFTRLFINGFHSYVILTQQMNDIINRKQKPYVIIEGLVDKNLKFKDNLLENKHKSKVLLYAGLLEEKYGVNMLVEAFSKNIHLNSELHLYGKGGSEDTIKAFSRKDDRIKYMGLVPNNIIVDEEIRATLLINPRPTDQEFTKYSFPSKNMEYMVSGTPVLTTALPGMPKEYFNHIYIINEETVEGLTNSINYILSLPSNELHKFGLEAKKFVLNEKNNEKQVKKILNMLKQIDKN